MEPSHEDRIRNRCQRATFTAPACEPRAKNACPMCHIADIYADLLAALNVAREALRANEEISGTWDLYQQSPEMKAINRALAQAEGR